MPSIRQILVDWTTVNGGGKLSVLYFEAASSVSSQRDAVNDMLDACMGACDNSTSYTIRTSGVEVDEEIGILTGSWAESTTYTQAGDQSTEPVADATMALLRFKTSTIFGSRFVQGRLYLPGIDRAQLTNGNLGASAVTALGNAANGLADAGVGFGIWSRPLRDTDGNVTREGRHSVATSGSCWSELAVLRRRRG